MENFLLQMIDISKNFNNTDALEHINFELISGEVHGLLGENGSGKSTLVKILGGICKMDEGQIKINGQAISINSVSDAREYGINLIHQEPAFVPSMTVAENLFLGREISGCFGFMKKKAMYEKAQEMLNDFDCGIQADTYVKRLTIAQKQIIEIVKAVSFNAKILAMDEPTSTLSENEISQLFHIIAKLKAKGIGIIYISHKIPELKRISDRITVIRDGSYIGTMKTAHVTTNQLVNMMVGRPAKNFYIRTYQPCSDNVVLSVRGLSYRNIVNDINFSVRKGEILGFTGKIGAGRSELMKCIVGLNKVDAGEIFVNGEKVTIRDPNDAASYGIVLVPENRELQSLFLNQSITYNLTLKTLSSFIHGPYLNRKQENSIAKDMIQDYSIKVRSQFENVKVLSGGNQQKVSIIKWLSTKPSILILDEPTRGIDVIAKSQIYSIMDRLASQGITIIMISSELPEIINMCDRVVIMNDGVIRGCLDRGDLSEEKIIHYEFGKD